MMTKIFGLEAGAARAAAGVATRWAWLMALSALVLLAIPTPGRAISLSSLLGDRDTRQFKIIHVNEVARLMALSARKPVILDADNPALRDQEGVIPGAVMLDSESAYNVAKALPSDKTTKLIFYCHNKA